MRRGCSIPARCFRPCIAAPSLAACMSTAASSPSLIFRGFDRTDDTAALVRRGGMFRLSAFDVRIELRRLSPVKSAVVAYDADLAVPERLDTVDLPGRPRVSRFRIFPAHEQRQLSRIVDTGEHIMLDDGAVLEIEAKMGRQQIGSGGKNGALGRHDLGKG